MKDVQDVLDSAMELGEEGRWEEMAQLLSETQDALEEDDPYLLCWLGMAEREMDNEGGAYEAFKRCLATNPLDPHLLALAGAGLAWFDDPDAESALRAAALTGPDIPLTRLHYGGYLAREGMFDEALEHLHAAVRLAPEDAVMHEELGNALAMKGDLAGAASAFEACLEIEEEDSWTRFLLGLVYLELGQLTEGAEAVSRAAADRTEDAEMQLVAALSAAAVGWDDAAHAALARADLAPEPAPSELFGEVEERIGAGAEAARAMLVDTLAPSILNDRLGQPL
jgi:tetratricopeptide (TPR) repeat protein